MLSPVSLNAACRCVLFRALVSVRHMSDKAVKDVSHLPRIKELLCETPGLTIATAESMTCGRLQRMIGDLPCASQFFRGGLTAYALDVKVKVLGVDKKKAEETCAVCREVAESMAVSVCKLFNTEIGLATTGFATPVPEHADEPYAYWAVADTRGGKPQVFTGRVDKPGCEAQEVQDAVAESVLKDGLLPHLERTSEARKRQKHAHHEDEDQPRQRPNQECCGTHN